MESKKELKPEYKKCNLCLENRKKLVITGVKEVISFNEEEISVTTELGALRVKGENLKMNKLDVQNEEMVIIGVIDSCVYTNRDKKREKDSIISRLFK
ncbi:sporulation protein YabP [Haloimpatiens sp. FM7315]|uniref:sporulation protein YabP n=1 Tax=Haloimpatiens sp. FM7315 TaxID=3298609 RepID=UPI00370BA84B